MSSSEPASEQGILPVTNQMTRWKPLDPAELIPGIYDLWDSAGAIRVKPEEYTAVVRWYVNDTKLPCIDVIDSSGVTLIQGALLESPRIASCDIRLLKAFPVQDPVKYRVIFFVTDPFMGIRFPVGAVIDSSGSQFVRATRLPCPWCLGGDAVAATLEMILNSLSRDSSGDIVGRFGPMVSVGPRLETPPENDPVKWIADHVLPC